MDEGNDIYVALKDVLDDFRKSIIDIVVKTNEKKKSKDNQKTIEKVAEPHPPPLLVRDPWDVQKNTISAIMNTEKVGDKISFDIIVFSYPKFFLIKKVCVFENTQLFIGECVFSVLKWSLRDQKNKVPHKVYKDYDELGPDIVRLDSSNIQNTFYALVRRSFSESNKISETFATSYSAKDMYYAYFKCTLGGDKKVTIQRVRGGFQLSPKQFAHISDTMFMIIKKKKNNDKRLSVFIDRDFRGAEEKPKIGRENLRSVSIHKGFKISSGHNLNVLSRKNDDVYLYTTVHQTVLKFSDGKNKFSDRTERQLINVETNRPSRVADVVNMCAIEYRDDKPPAILHITNTNIHESMITMSLAEDIPIVFLSDLHRRHKTTKHVLSYAKNGDGTVSANYGEKNLNIILKRKNVQMIQHVRFETEKKNNKSDVLALQCVLPEIFSIDGNNYVTIKLEQGEKNEHCYCILKVNGNMILEKMKFLIGSISELSFEVLSDNKIHIKQNNSKQEKKYIFDPSNFDSCTKTVNFDTEVVADDDEQESYYASEVVDSDNSENDDATDYFDSVEYGDSDEYE